MVDVTAQATKGPLKWSQLKSETILKHSHHSRIHSNTPRCQKISQNILEYTYEHPQGNE